MKPIIHSTEMNFFFFIFFFPPMAVLATFTAEQYDKYHMFTFRPLCYLLVTAFPAAVVAV